MATPCWLQGSLPLALTYTSILVSRLGIPISMSTLCAICNLEDAVPVCSLKACTPCCLASLSAPVRTGRPCGLHIGQLGEPTPEILPTTCLAAAAANMGADPVVYSHLWRAATLSDALGLVSVWGPALGENTATMLMSLGANLAPPTLDPALDPWCPEPLRRFVAGKGWLTAAQLLEHALEVQLEAIKLGIVETFVPFWKKVQESADKPAAPTEPMGDGLLGLLAPFGPVPPSSPPPSDLASGQNGGNLFAAGVAKFLLGKELEKRDAKKRYQDRPLVYNTLKRVWEHEEEEPWRSAVSPTEGLTILLEPLQLLRGAGGGG
jgi:hypothetical protein